MTGDATTESEVQAMNRCDYCWPDDAQTTITNGNGEPCCRFCGGSRR